MATQLPPLRGVAFYFDVSLISQAATEVFQTNPTLAAGDVVVYQDGVLDGNIDALPVAIGGGKVVGCWLSVAEMTADQITVLFSDAAGAEWCDLLVTINTCVVGLTIADDAITSDTFDEATAYPRTCEDLCGDPTAIWFTYTVTDVATGLPIEGVTIDITTDIGGLNNVWCGTTDPFGVARDDDGRLPRLQPGTYYFWRELSGWVFAPNPDPEIVS